MQRHIEECRQKDRRGEVVSRSGATHRRLEVDERLVDGLRVNKNDWTRYRKKQGRWK